MKLYVGSKQLRMQKKGTDFPYCHGNYAGTRSGLLMPRNFFLFVTLLNRKVYERGIAIKQFLIRNDFDIVGYEEICN